MYTSVPPRSDPPAPVPLPQDFISRIRRASPWPAFCGGLGLLTLALPAGVAGVWLLWGSLFAADGAQVFGPGADAYHRYKSGESIHLVLRRS